MTRSPISLRNGLCCVFAALTLLSCGGTAAAPATPRSEGGSTASAPAAKEWANMNRDERLEYMGLTVMPAMSKVFKAYDPKGFANFQCQTCHGQDMEKADFKLPNGLFALPAAHPIASATAYDERTTLFMRNRVVPEMAKLLQRQPGAGLNCMSCHENE